MRLNYRHLFLGLVVATAVAGIIALGGVTPAEATVYGAVTVLSAQLTEGVRNYPIDSHGKLRTAYFYYKNETGGTLADGTQIDLLDLPAGRVRILPNLSRYRATAMSTSRVLNIGHRAYYPLSTPPNSDPQAEDNNGFVAADDISSAVLDAPFDGGAAKMKKDLYSRGGIRLFAEVTGGTIPANAEIEGYVTYVCE